MVQVCSVNSFPTVVPFKCSISSAMKPTWFSMVLLLSGDLGTVVDLVDPLPPFVFSPVVSDEKKMPIDRSYYVDITKNNLTIRCD